LGNPRSESRARSGDRRDQSERKVWQPSWHAEGLVSENLWEQKMNYIHENPVRKGYVRLPEHWRYSSARYWLTGEDGDLPVVSVQPEEE
jgi:REP element-mobilizing transposase RayT